MKFLAATDHAQIKLPKLACETQRRPALIQVSDEFKAERTPEVSERYVSANRSELNRGVEREGSAVRHEAGERVAVEVVAMGRIRGPIRI